MKKPWRLPPGLFKNARKIRRPSSCFFYKMQRTGAMRRYLKKLMQSAHRRRSVKLDCDQFIRKAIKKQQYVRRDLKYIEAY